MENLNNSTIIRNISKDQKEILYNIMQLHNNGEAFDCDMTASKLIFYKKKKGDKYEIPKPRYLFDVYPMSDEITKITQFNKLPLEDKSISSIVIDLPFVISPHNAPSVEKADASLIAKRFSGFYPVMELYENYFWWINEAYRVLKDDGICVFKCQSMVSGGIQHWSEEYSFLCAQKAGFYVKDKFYLQADNRLISPGKYKAQQHARKYTSVFFVFQKGNNKKAEKVDYINMLNNMSVESLEGKVWEVK